MKKKKSQDNQIATFKEKVADRLDVSKEVILDVPKIVFIGNREVAVENYKSIREYTENKIILDSDPMCLKFSGKELEIRSISREMLFITGRIEKMEFGGEG